MRPETGVHVQPHDRALPQHLVRVAPGSLLGRVSGQSELAVNSTHHQVVRKVAPGLRATGFAPDGVIEAIESEDHRFVLGVQWHPEMLPADEQRALYRGLVEAARRSGEPQKPSK